MGPGDHDGHDICSCNSNGVLQLVSRPLIAQKTGPVMEDQPYKEESWKTQSKCHCQPPAIRTCSSSERSYSAQSLDSPQPRERARSGTQHSVDSRTDNPTARPPDWSMQE